jgi:hypothetical protein
VSDTWSPEADADADSPDTEAFEQGDEALDEATRLDPDLDEALQGDPSLDPTLQVDERELKEIGADLDDPEKEGWELDDAIAGKPATDESD